MSEKMRRHPDRGFTLPELLIVISIMGIVLVTIAGIFTVIVRGAPSTAARIDDARSLLGLTTWIPRDVNSTEVTGFDGSPYADGVFTDGDGSVSQACATGSIPSGADEILKLRWSQSGNTYVADYRFVYNDAAKSSGQIIRYACLANGIPTPNTLSSTLPVIPSGFTGDAPNLNPLPVNLQVVSENGTNVGVQFEVVVIDEKTGTVRTLLSLEAVTANVVTTFPAVVGPPGSVNSAPIAPSYEVEVTEGVPQDVAILAVDPDGDDLVLTIDSIMWGDPPGSPPPSPGLTYSDADSLNLTGLTAPAGTADTSFVIEYTVVDPDGEQSSGVITVNVLPDPGPSPTSTLPLTLGCSGTIVSVNPQTVANKGPGNSATDKGPLTSGITVTITFEPACSSLVLAFDPDPEDGYFVQEVENFSGGTTVVIAKNAYDWHDNPGHLLQLREGSNGTVLAFDYLEVT